jgi:DegV family protein with EDD domain
VATDSVSNIPRELADSHHIYIAPIHLLWEGEEYRDEIDITPEEFYSRLRVAKELPTTSGAIQGEFLRIFEELRGKVDGVVVIVLSPDLPSAGYSSALAAREMVEGLLIEVIDSRLALIAQGLVVLAAARAAQAGANMKEVARVARETIPKVHIFFVPENLIYLKKTGRFSMPATANELLTLRPVLTLRDGKVALRERTTRGEPIPHLLKLIRQNVTSSPLHLGVMHADAKVEAEKLRREIASNFRCAELLITDISPTLGTHAGPGTLGVAFYNE